MTAVTYRAPDRVNFIEAFLALSHRPAAIAQRVDLIVWLREENFSPAADCVRSLHNVYDFPAHP